MDRGFENLRVWQQSRIFVNSIYDIMEEIKDYGFRDQIQRAAVSIMNNIAEGAESGSDAKYVNSFEKLKSESILISNHIYRLIESLKKH